MSLLGNIDLETFLEELGVETFGYVKDELIGRCPGHADKKYAGVPDRTPGNWTINSETGDHHCFSCNFGGSLYWLVAWMRRKGGKSPTPAEIQSARTYLVHHAGDSLDRVHKLSTSVPKAEERRVMDESRLALYTAPPAWALIERNLAQSAADDYGILWDPDLDAWITPIRDPKTTKLWGWQAKGQVTRLFRNLPSGVKKSDTLFGIDLLRTEERTTPSGVRQAVLVESPLDTARLRTAGVFGGISSYGAIVSDEQMRVICEVADELVLALDNDAAGVKAMMALLGCNKSGVRLKSMQDWSQRITIKVFNYLGSNVKDVGEMPGVAVIRAGVQNAVPAIVRGPKAVLTACS